MGSRDPPTYLHAPNTLRALRQAFNDTWVEVQARDPNKGSAMDRQMLLYHLVEAEQRTAVGKNDIQEQYRLIAELMRHGEDTVEGVAVLNQLIEAQEKHEADRDRLKVELAEKYVRPRSLPLDL